MLILSRGILEGKMVVYDVIDVADNVMNQAC